MEAAFAEGHKSFREGTEKNIKVYQWISGFELRAAAEESGVDIFGMQTPERRSNLNI